MAPRNLDKKGRWRDQILGIHVTESERARLEELAVSAGTNKRKYLIDCLEDSTIHVAKNTRIASLLEERLRNVRTRLLQAHEIIDASEEEYNEALFLLEKALGIR